MTWRLLPRIMLVIALLALFSFGPAWPAPQAVAERIRDFAVTVELKRDSSLVVTERITADVENLTIRHGIHRDFPLCIRRPDGSCGRAGFEVLQILRDGEPEEWISRTVRNRARVYIGRRNALLPPGLHTWTLTYRTTRRIRHVEDHDELRWNVTGTDWTFPIDHARIELLLPEGTPILAAVLQTGRPGERGRDVRILRQTPGRFEAATTRPLRPGEGFTVAIAFPKGVVARPSTIETFLDDLMDDIGHWWMLAVSLAVTGYFVWAWLKVGRDPRRDPLIPRWDPPAGLSPAATARLKAEAGIAGFDEARAFAATIVSLAVKGYVQLERAITGRTRIIRQRQPDDDLPPGERAIMHALFGDRLAVTLDRTERERLSETLRSFITATENEYRDRFSLRNYLWLTIGIALAVLAAATLLSVAEMTDVRRIGPFHLLTIGLITAGAIVMFRRLRPAWTNASRPIRIAGLIGISLIGLSLLLPPTSILHVAGTGLGQRQAIVTDMALLGLPLAVIVFYFLLPRPVRAGRRAMDELEGLEMFLRMAEAPRIEMAERGAPAMSVSLFEHFLPYAVALGLERSWTSAFRRWLETAEAARLTGHAYRPSWYGGQIMFPETVEDMVQDISRGMRQDLIAATPRLSSPPGATSPAADEGRAK